jgi:hypothetical protein
MSAMWGFIWGSLQGVGRGEGQAGVRMARLEMGVKSCF